MFRTQTTTTESRIDDLELTLETLKDLTVTARAADAVKGGVTSSQRACFCGSM